MQVPACQQEEFHSVLPIRKQIVQAITAKLQTGYIFLLSETKEQQTTRTIFSTAEIKGKTITHYHLLVTINEFNHQNSETIQDWIETSCSSFIKVTAWVIASTSLLQGIREGHYFYWLTAEKAEQLYSHSTTAKELISHISVPALPNPAPWFNRSAQFLAAAKLLLLRNQPSMAAFQLHQAAEQAYTGIIFSCTGYRPPTHNLLRLHRYTLFFQPSAELVFPPASPHEETLLQYLQKAYIQSRYTDSFPARSSKLELLVTAVEQLQQIGKSPGYSAAYPTP